MEEKKELEFNMDLNPSNSFYRALSQFSAEEARFYSEDYSYFYRAMKEIMDIAKSGRRSALFTEVLTSDNVDRIEAMGYTISSKENLDETTNIYETVKITW